MTERKLHMDLSKDYMEFHDRVTNTILRFFPALTSTKIDTSWTFAHMLGGKLNVCNISHDLMS